MLSTAERGGQGHPQPPQLSFDGPGLDLSRLNFLIIEQNLLMRDALTRTLRALGVGSLRAAECVSSGFEACQEDPPDILLADWSPYMNGLELLKKIRTAPESPNRFLPVIMVSANTEVDNVLKARDYGTNDFLAKPVRVPTLYGRIHRVVMSERPFVWTLDFFGPDRRRRKMRFTGPDRREADPVRRTHH